MEALTAENTCLLYTAMVLRCESVDATGGSGLTCLCTKRLKSWLEPENLRTSCTVCGGGQSLRTLTLSGSGGYPRL
jgi:hypothetical protein